MSFVLQHSEHVCGLRSHLTPTTTHPTTHRQLCPLLSASSTSQWRSQEFSKGGACQRKKCLALQITFLALYSPPGIFSPRRMPVPLGHPLPSPRLRPCHILDIIYVFTTVLTLIFASISSPSSPCSSIIAVRLRIKIRCSTVASPQPHSRSSARHPHPHVDP
jgi:hypothetical protein